MKENEITAGHLYKTSGNQERIVLEISNSQVEYAYRGGNAMNDWNTRQSAKLSTFAAAVDEDLGAVKADKLDEVKKSCNYS